MVAADRIVRINPEITVDAVQTVLTEENALELPDTLRFLLRSAAPIAVSVSSHINGCPVLLNQCAISSLLKEDPVSNLEAAIEKSWLTKEYVPVSDSGIFLRGDNLSRKQEVIERQSSQLSRPIAEVAICNGSPLYDSRLAMLLHLVEDTHSVQDAYDRFTEHLNREAQRLYTQLFDTAEWS